MASAWCAAAHGGVGYGGQLVCCGGRRRRLQRLLRTAPAGPLRRTTARPCVARTKMPRNGVAQGLKVEAVLAAEAAWEQ